MVICYLYNNITINIQFAIVCDRGVTVAYGKAVLLLCMGNATDTVKMNKEFWRKSRMFA
jgi:hypothetical protein